MPSTKIVLYGRGMAELMKSPKLAAELHRRAEKAAAAARASAPVVTGGYRDDIEVVDEVHQTRVVARVYANSAYASTVEANTGNLARSLDSAGGA